MDKGSANFIEHTQETEGAIDIDDVMGYWRYLEV